MPLAAIFAAQRKMTLAQRCPKQNWSHAPTVNIAIKDDSYPAMTLKISLGRDRNQARLPLELRGTPHACGRRLSRPRTKMRTGMMAGDHINSCYCVIPDIKLTETP